MPYEFLDDVALADVAFRAWGSDLTEVFRAAWDATLRVMIDNPERVEAREESVFTLKNEDLDMLLFDFLQEQIYLKDAQHLLLRIDSLEVHRGDETFRLTARCQGEKLDPERHHQIVDVKGVTLHRFELRETTAGWEATVVLDI